ncbi:TPA: YifB family Mg chelatase-like AAA ATPase [Vibrio parahaemolyticus]
MSETTHTIRSHHDLVFMLNFLAKGSKGAERTNLSILSIIADFCNYRTESCHPKTDTIVDKAFELGLPMPSKEESQKNKISRAIKWGIENLPGFSRKLNSKQNEFGEYEGRKPSTYFFDLSVIQDYFNGIKPMLEKRLYQQKKAAATKAEKKAYRKAQAEKAALEAAPDEANKMLSRDSEILLSSNIKNNKRIDLTSDTQARQCNSLSDFNSRNELRTLNDKLAKHVEFLRSKLKQITSKSNKTLTPPALQTLEQYQAQFAQENAQAETHKQVAARNETAASFADGFFVWIGETPVKRKAIRYRPLRMAILSRISEIYSERGDVEYTVIEERLTNWGDTSYSKLFLGPPGTGKTMLASRLCDLLPEMSDEEAMETASVASLTQSEINEHNWKSRPFRAPHHSSSMAALVGGGSVPRPGEISLAHNGLLFLDEMPEFDRKVLDSLREPLESGEIIISRAQGKTRFPARFQLVGALNPSPTGYYEGNQARTNPQAILRYLGRLSGPLLDRFDMSLEIPSLPKGTLAEGGDRGEPTELVKDRVSLARESMLNRNGKVNALLGSREIEAFCPLQKSDAEFLETALHRLGLSIRAYHRIIKVARTIADLEGAEQIERSHLAEALGYRAMDRLLKQLTAQAV